LSEELSRLGGSISIEEESLVVRPCPLVGANVDPHGDHRIAMAVALVGLRVEGVTISDPGVVNKTWPGYWDMLDTLVK
jgi:3-phosphoshikimate 1-carboxyvinyltransferase